MLHVGISSWSWWSSYNQAVTWRFDRSLSKTEEWIGGNFPGQTSSPNPQLMLRELRGAREFTFIRDSDDESSTISLEGLLDTPAQPNIDRCGTY